MSSPATSVTSPTRKPLRIPCISSLATIAERRKVCGLPGARCQSWRAPTPPSGSSLRSRRVPPATVTRARSPSICQPSTNSSGGTVGSGAVGDPGEVEVVGPWRRDRLELTQVGEGDQRDGRQGQGGEKPSDGSGVAGVPGAARSRLRRHSARAKSRPWAGSARSGPVARLASGLRLLLVSDDPFPAHVDR